MSETLDPRVARAKSYPFPRHDHCFLFVDGETTRLDHGPCDVSGRVPVLAVGSNQSHEQLRRKYQGIAGCVIPVWRGRIHDFDVVYAAKFTGYGSVPATFQRSPGTAVTVFVQWLTPSQLAHMHETEGGYDYDQLTGLRIVLDRGGEMVDAFAYSSSTGCLSHKGGPIALAEIAAERRRFPQMTQPEILDVVRARLAPDMALDAFIAQQLDEPVLRAERANRLFADSLPLLYPRETLMSFPGSAIPTR